MIISWLALAGFEIYFIMSPNIRLVISANFMSANIANIANIGYRRLDSIIGL